MLRIILQNLSRRNRIVNIINFHVFINHFLLGMQSQAKTPLFHLPLYTIQQHFRIGQIAIVHIPFTFLIT
ncbi:MAG: hypothetical protein O2954_08950 [bacterium]|nr:hypothetical protein [bacterium]